MTAQRYWYNIATHHVETDADPGRSGDRLGPYRSADEAARALESARLRTLAWEASDADSRGRTSWTPPPPAPLTRLERWILAHPRRFRVLMFAAAGVLAVLDVVLVVTTRRLPLSFWPVILVVYGVWGVPAARRRAEELGEDAADE
ncbi:MAG TPA: hypothetical protein VE781_14570 [Kineosporiaceae bacterium]|nr:hypothetical protein [Kineosporiaceae bacterium]